VEEEEEEVALPVPTPLPVNNMVDSHHGLMETSTPLPTHLPTHLNPQPPGVPLSVAPAYHDPQTPAPFLAPHTPGGPLSVAQSFLDSTVAGQFMDSHAPSSMLDNTAIPATPHHVNLSQPEMPVLPSDQVSYSELKPH